MTRNVLRAAALAAILGVGAATAACSSSTDGTAAQPSSPRLPASDGSSSTSTASSTASSTTPMTGGATAGCEGRHTYIVTLCLTFDFTGDVTLKGSTWNVPPGGPTGGSCADWAAATTNPFGIQMDGDKHIDVDGTSKNVAGSFLVEDYHGPGTYQVPTELKSVMATNGFGLDDLRTNFDLPSGATGQLEVKADGGGQATFDKLSTADGTPASISGSITWTCMGAQG